MKTGFLESLGLCAKLLAETALLGAEGAFKRAAGAAPKYLTAMLVTTAAALTIVPALALLKMLTGWWIFGYAMAFFAVSFTLVLGLMWFPISVLVGMLIGLTLDAKAVGERYVRMVGILLFAELMLTPYFLITPFHHNRPAIPIFMISAAAVAIGSAIWGGWLSGKFYIGLALAMTLRVAMSFFLPETFQAIEGELSQLDGRLAKAIREPSPRTQARDAPSQLPSQPPPAVRVIKIEVSPDKDSDWITIPSGPFTFEAPGRISFTFPNGKIMTVGDGEKNKRLGDIPSRRFRLRGAAGTVTITSK